MDSLVQRICIGLKRTKYQKRGVPLLSIDSLIIKSCFTFRGQDEIPLFSSFNLFAWPMHYCTLFRWLTKEKAFYPLLEQFLLFRNVVVVRFIMWSIQLGIQIFPLCTWWYFWQKMICEDKIYTNLTSCSVS